MPVFGSDSVAGSSPEIVIEPPGETKPFDTPSTGASTVVTWVPAGFVPGVATAELVMVPPTGTALGLVTTSLDLGRRTDRERRRAVQSTGPVPVQLAGRRWRSRASCPAGACRRRARRRPRWCRCW